MKRAHDAAAFGPALVSAILSGGEAYNEHAETAAKTLRLECAGPGTCAVSHVPGHCVTGDRP